MKVTREMERDSDSDSLFDETGRGRSERRLRVERNVIVDLPRPYGRLR